MNRRQLGLSCAGLALASAALSGCAGLNVATVSQSVVTDLGYLKNGLSVILGAAQALGFSPATAAVITNQTQTAISLISSIAAGMAQNAARPIVTQIQNDLNSLFPAMQTAGVALPPLVTQILQAVIVLAPAIYQAVGLVTAVGATPAAPENLNAARQILAGV